MLLIILQRYCDQDFIALKNQSLTLSLQGQTERFDTGVLLWVKTRKTTTLAVQWTMNENIKNHF